MFSNKWGLPPFFHLYTNPVLGHFLVYFVNKIHVLVVTVELIWSSFLNILSFYFVLTLNKFLRFARFRRNYINGPAIFLIKVTQLFCLLCIVQSSHTILQLFVPNDSAFASPVFAEHTCCSNVFNFKVDKQTERCEIVIDKGIKTKSWS